MITIVVLVFGVVVGFVIAWALKSEDKQIETKKEEVLAEDISGIGKVNREKARVKNERKEKILEFLKEKGKAGNGEIQTLLGIADSTVTVYLDELEKEGKIRQIGEVGQGVRYELNG
ncbi:MAG: hypothetical protein ACD_11C00108G0004 [uncultured bacterium]|nr:MAG: hypothetical protein ACD_11C00108G0004 [uncultured bacterium]HBR71410.1 hypothetical protein [Candidatus Moranbacteria bacterium]